MKHLLVMSEKGVVPACSFPYGGTAFSSEKATCPHCRRIQLKLHPKDLDVYMKTANLGMHLADMYKLRDVSTILPLCWTSYNRGQVKGYYFQGDGVIMILFRKRAPKKKGGAWGRFLGLADVMDTLCHELAHARHFDHSDEFYRFADEISFTLAEMLGVPEPPSED
jgi:hypothetical protein